MTVVVFEVSADGVFQFAGAAMNWRAATNWCLHCRGMLPPPLLMISIRRSFITLVI